MKELKRVVIKEELVALTGDFKPALILNQFLYWTQRMFDTDKYIDEEISRASKENMEVCIDKSKGWIYKSTEELIEELMVGGSVSTTRKYIKQLVDAGYISERRNPKYKWDKTLQYRVNLYKIQKDLGTLGYVLEGYRLLPGIQIVSEDEIMEIVEAKKVEENKKVVPAPTDTTNENHENNFNNDSISDDTENIQEEKNVNEKTYTDTQLKEIAYNNLKDCPVFVNYPPITKEIKIKAEVNKLKTLVGIGIDIENNQ